MHHDINFELVQVDGYVRMIWNIKEKHNHWNGKYFINNKSSEWIYCLALKANK